MSLYYARGHKFIRAVEIKRGMQNGSEAHEGRRNGEAGMSTKQCSICGTIELHARTRACIPLQRRPTSYDRCLVWCYCDCGDKAVNCPAGRSKPRCDASERATSRVCDMHS